METNNESSPLAIDQELLALMKQELKNWEKEKEAHNRFKKQVEGMSDEKRRELGQRIYQRMAAKDRATKT